MLQITKWSPDTCECIIEYEWDDSIPNDTRIHNGKNVIKACSAHQNTLNAKDHFSKVVEENQRKNTFLKKVMDTIPTLKETVIQEDSSTIERLKKGIIYNWNFDSNRNLVVEFKGQTIDKNILQDISNTHFKDKKVVIK